MLDFSHKPGVVVAVTDGEETCGRSPCELGKQLHAAAEQLTVHIIGLRVKGFSWTGEQSILDESASPSRITGFISPPRRRTT